jgi:hypothetical protein
MLHVVIRGVPTQLGLPATLTTVGRDDVPIRAPFKPVAL